MQSKSALKGFELKQFGSVNSICYLSLKMMILHDLHFAQGNVSDKQETRGRVYSTQKHLGVIF